MSRWKFAFEYNFTQLTVKFPGMKLIILLRLNGNRLFRL